ncbi:carboxypeptidase M32 [Tropicimonas sediminicola]|uniref:Metal-dependent carboxypeptidase n=1 Tax=Tropicimonas sediminicola TaxID=1031541 RepID=A0A239JRK0_9RHOB|nr:carboxypeptidase M32 [Tropicimonas sediminicola]SNT08470.1 carboxypeptidase Taq [Tropicimonas sediminicola]
MSAYDALMAHARETEALKQVLGRLGWDQETVMPSGAAPQRAEEMAALETVLHARKVDPRVSDWLAAAEPADAVAEAQLREIRREHLRATRVPADLAAAIARTTSLAQGIWAEARASDNFTAFAPTLSEVLSLRRREAEALADRGDLYDALLDDYEAGETAASLTAMFDAMRPRLVALREAVLEQGERVSRLDGHFDEAAQLRLATETARAFGYDFDHERIDKAVHPFSSGQGLDSRITTRTDPADPFNCLYSTIHEVGHGCYEQNVKRDFLLTPLGAGVSMGVHESQSRIYENQLGRSRAFTGWLHGRFREAFDGFGVEDPEHFYAIVNAVRPGYIRTEADEVQYNLHILMRFDLERALIGGDLEVADLEAAWNDRFADDFGLQVDRASNGVLQDVHWAVGLFGYFPTYTLGNVYAGCLFKALKQAVPEWEEALARGDATPATGWLREAVQQHGALMTPRAVIEGATGEPISVAPLLDYLEAKFGGLYGL